MDKWNFHSDAEKLKRVVLNFFLNEIKDMTQSLTDLKIKERLTRKETDQLMHEYRELELKSEDLTMKL